MFRRVPGPEVFVRPAVAAERKAELNQKLQDMGKPPIP